MRRVTSVPDTSRPPCSGDAGEVDPSLFGRILDALLFECDGPSVDHIGVAVSGGADSMALALLAGAWATARGVRLTALTVDHRLRPEAAAEARQVAAWLGDRGIAHETLAPAGPPEKRTQAAARALRYRVLSGWSRRHGGAPILTAHHADDRLETLVMRLDAETGVDGLTGPAPYSRLEGIEILRPLLRTPKKALKATCKAFAQPWIEDPSNRDPSFTRVRVRSEMPALLQAGLSAPQLHRLMDAVSGLGAAVDGFAAHWFRDHVHVTDAGYLQFPASALNAWPSALAGRLLGNLIRSVGGASYPARADALERLAALAGDEEPFRVTLGGVLAERDARGDILLVREAAGMAGPAAVVGGVPARWDNRFEILTEPHCPPLIVTGLGAAGWRRQKRLTPRHPRIPGLSDSMVASLPWVCDLDGRAAVPHLIGEIGHVGPSDLPPWLPSVRITFSPVVDWCRRAWQDAPLWRGKFAGSPGVGHLPMPRDRLSGRVA